MHELKLTKVFCFLLPRENNKALNELKVIYSFLTPPTLYSNIANMQKRAEKDENSNQQETKIMISTRKRMEKLLRPEVGNLDPTRNLQ